MLSETSQAVADTLSNIANKLIIRVVSRSVEPTLSCLRALKKQILNVSKGIQIKVQKISNFRFRIYTELVLWKIVEVLRFLCLKQ